MNEWYKLDIADIFSKLHSSHSGLTDSTLDSKIKLFGKNVPAENKKVSVVLIFFRQFRSAIIYILLVAAIISLFIGDKKEFYVISSIIGFIVLLSFFEEYKATRDMESLKKLTPHIARVRRNGIEFKIDSQELLPGDIILLNRGDIVPADARIITSSDLKINESALTGESVPVEKKNIRIVDTVSLAERINIVFTGSLIVNGRGEAIVVETGNNTEIGKIASLIVDSKDERSPLQKRLDFLSYKFGLIVLIVCVSIFIIGLLRNGIGTLETLLVLVIAVAVAGIPESLPAVISVSLAVGVKRMAKKNAIIKKLSSVETLGTCTVICSDKTGTLTQNKMVVEHLWTPCKFTTISGEGFVPKGNFFEKNVQIKPLLHKDIAKMLEIGVLCNDSGLHFDKDTWKIVGEATEAALLVVAKKAGLEKDILHNKYPRIAEQAFNSDKKYMTCIHKVGKRNTLYAKGAPEILLGKSSYYMRNGVAKKITPAIKLEIAEKQKAFSSEGYRVIGLAYKIVTGSKISKKYNDTNLIFAGLACIRDPPEPSAKEAIQKCHEAGIRTVMITGDNHLTARSVAEELGILTADMQVLTGSEIDAMDDHSFRKIVSSVAVFARVSPSHKLRIVTALQDNGEIVAMTGDGVNDAPALKKANIGIAMGREGTDVARDASEMILKDDNFSTIVSAIEEGRNIYNNIIRFIYYLFPGNLSQILIILISTIAGVLPPITSLMILFINLVTSDFPALGLAIEKSNQDVMKQKPRNPKEEILTGYLTLKIGQVVPMIVLGTIGLFLWELYVLKVDYITAQTVAFVSIICFMIFHSFNAKAITSSIFSKDMFTNIFFYGGLALSIASTFIVLYVPSVANIFGTVPLTFEQWIPILIVSSIVMLYTELQKVIIRSELEESNKLL